MVIPISDRVTVCEAGVSGSANLRRDFYWGPRTMESETFMAGGRASTCPGEGSQEAVANRDFGGGTQEEKVGGEGRGDGRIVSLSPVATSLLSVATIAVKA